ncbi:polyketide synthase [Trichoderma atroviride IMI 206040]|uniref:Polyketide synthase n=1 Tax=Hypocrea atroviridis (strain ATCC 20476 / IMI 206040) TaxID=452589 RepID=G9P4V6_HYPAI|nr:polyketide synthase [Trichoderma atroviride IMI 206040]EHK42038.1 polyketide synthase [Trichoderma atroviride IMI 206040]
MTSSNPVDPHWLDANGDEPIAIIGVACRFSGTASDEDGLWQLLSKGRTSWASNARSRFRMESFWHPQAHLPGSTSARGVHLLQQDPAVFDSDFFGISGVEAKAIDPQQRLMLEVAYETFENAGIPLEKLEKSNTGVFCAVSYTDYDQILGRDPETSPMYRFTGTGPSLVSSRVSYAFDLRGPSKAVDTACSSASVALHDAILALRAGDADQILVGGSNLILDPDKMSIISSMSFLSPDGRCYSFDSRASGYARGEGVVALLLKPLSAALRDGDTVRSVIRGSAVVSDGKTPGITMPSPDAQFAAIQRAYKVAGLDPRETVYVEAHGTGTNAGDNVEAEAFNRAFCSDNSEKQLIIGSVKSNLGHTECVSGLAGLVKVLLMLEKRKLVPTPTFVNENPRLELERRRLKVSTQFQDWPEGLIRRASINGSGYGGTDTHVILEAWTEPTKVIEPTSTSELRAARGPNISEPAASKSRVFVWSHQRDDGCSKMANAWKKFMRVAKANREELSLDDLAYTLSERRSRFAQRTAVVASTVEELLEGLNKIELGSLRPVKAWTNARRCFIFTGQGAQWAEMGLGLLSYPLFADSMQKSEREFIRMGATWRLIDELKKTKETSRINEAELAQPVCTAIQIALVDLLASWNVHPDAVCGHSSGEIAAAYAAGALTAPEALRAAYHRGQSVYQIMRKEGARQGGMLAAGLSDTDAQKYLSKYSEYAVNVACINSPTSVTISGDVSAIEEIGARLEEDGIFNRRLAVPVAYHSSHMNVIEGLYGDALKSLQPRKFKPGVRMISSVTCEELSGEEMDGSYWVSNLLRPVRFSPALTKLLSLTASATDKDGSATVLPTVMIELGPHAALQGPATQIAKTVKELSSVTYFSCLKRKEGAVQSMLSTAAGLFNYGLAIDLIGINNPHGTRTKVLTNLPAYSWHHGKIHWNESRRSQVYRMREFPRHDLLGTAAADSISAEPSWRMYIRLSEMPWIKGHSIDGQVLYSAAGFLAMIVEALKRQSITSNRPWLKKVIQFKKIVIDRPLLIQEDAFGAEVFTLLRPYSVTSRDSSQKWQEFRIYSISPNNESTEHCRGLIALSEDLGKLGVKPDTATDSLQNEDGSALWTQLESKQLYKLLSASGNDYSGCFANLDNISARPWQSNSELYVQDVKATMPGGHQEVHHIHPTTLEGCFLATLSGVKLADGLDGPQVVTSIDELYIPTDIDLQPGHKLSVAAKSNPYGLRQHSSHIVATDNANNVVVRVEGIKFSSLGSYQADANGDDNRLSHQVEWLVDPFSSTKQAVAEYCQSNLDQKSQEQRKNLDPISLSIIKDTLGQLSSEDEPLITGHLRRFYDWMRGQDTANVLPLSSDDKTQGITNQLLVQIAPHLPGILRGNQEFLIDESQLHHLYSEDDGFNRCHTQLAEYLKLVQYKVPNLRVLEVGAGAGNLTFTLLEALHGEKRDYATTPGTYVLTEASESSIASAQEKLKKFESVVEFKPLDIEQSPAQQGFELGSFDIIIASNALHATHNLENTLGHLRSLLKPGGQIAFAELTAPSLRWGVLGGGLQSWWLGAEDGRTSSSLVSTSEWDKALVKSGFSGVSLELKDFDSDQEHEVSLLISHAANIQLKAHAENISIFTGKESDSVASELRRALAAQHLETAVSTVSLSGEVASPGTYIFLPEVSEDALLRASENDWDKVQHLLVNAKAVLWVTKGPSLAEPEPHRALITGLARSLRSSRPDLDFFTLDIGTGSDEASAILQVYEKYLGPNASPYSASEWELAFYNGSIVIPRLLENKAVNQQVKDAVSSHHPREEIYNDASRSLGLQISSVGVLDSLYWADSEFHAASPKPTQIRVQVENFALNFNDMLTTTGQLEGNSSLLLEGSGTVVHVGDASQTKFTVGDRVSFFAPDGLATVSNVDARHAVKIPEAIASDVAAAIPLAYSTALYALRNIARLQRGESILIQSGAGAVGQASIALAKALGAEDIFVTVGSPDRAEFVNKSFGIPTERIFSSRDLDVGDRLLKQTNGQGVDVVLNSLSGDAFSESCSAVASFGRIVQLCERDVANNGQLGLEALQRNASLSVVNMAFLARERPAAFEELLQTSFKMLQEGTLALMSPITTSHASNVAEQLRIMQAGDQLGKAVFKLDSSLPLKIQPRKPKSAALRENSSYFVAGSNGGLDVAVAKYLAKLGASRLIARQGSDIEVLTDEIKKLGADVAIIPGNVSDRPIADQLKEASVGVPLKGIILGDSETQIADVQALTHSQWSTAIESSTAGILSLQNAFGSELDFFLLLNSTSSVVGSPEQGIAGAIGAFRDSFARSQASQGFPVKAIDIGAVQQEGSDDAQNASPSSDVQPQKIEEVLAVINYAIQNPIAANPSQAQIVCGASLFAPDPSSPATRRPDARFAHVWSRAAPRVSKSGKDAFDVQAVLRSASSAEVAVEAVYTGLKEKLAGLLSVATKEIQSDRSVSSYGVDSLISVELRNWITGHLGGHVQMLELMSSLSMMQLSDLIAKRSRLVPANVFGSAEAANAEKN